MSDKYATQETPVYHEELPDDKNEVVGKACVMLVVTPDGKVHAHVSIEGDLLPGRYTVFVDLKEANRTGLKVKP